MIDNLVFLISVLCVQPPRSRAKLLRSFLWVCDWFPSTRLLVVQNTRHLLQRHQVSNECLTSVC